MLQLFFVLFLGLACFSYYKINKLSYSDPECIKGVSHSCKGLQTYNWILTVYLIFTILKNILLSSILFYCLYKFYQGLRQIGLKFQPKRCILSVHIFAFGLPIVAGLIYIVCIVKFNQIAIFTSTRATKTYWRVLAVTTLYCVTMAIV